MEIDAMTIPEIRALIDQKQGEELKALIRVVQNDPRKGVRNLHKTILRKIERDKGSIEKKNLLLKEENRLWDLNYQWVGGMDEAGRGPLAGPVVAACVVFGRNTYIEGVNDSKKLSPKTRDRLFDIIVKEAEVIGIGRVDSREIDRINILNATKLAMRMAVSKCYPKMDFLLVDAVDDKFQVPHKSITKGDMRSHSIAAASIIAKVTRDREMLKWHKRYPDYGFDRNKGYGTGQHIKSIEEIGLCPIHRKTFTRGMIIKGQGDGYL